MSPEQAGGQRAVLDARTDIYPLGATMYEMLTLRPMFDEADQARMLRKVLHDEPVPPRRINPAVPTELETIVLKAAAKSPADRYGSAAELAGDLRRFLEHRPILARRPTMFAPILRCVEGLGWLADCVDTPTHPGTVYYVSDGRRFLGRTARLVISEKSDATNRHKNCHKLHMINRSED